nr:MAG TPA: hypothetical protein [Inoviridae sp.]
MFIKTGRSGIANAPSSIFWLASSVNLARSPVKK